MPVHAAGANQTFNISYNINMMPPAQPNLQLA